MGGEKRIQVEAIYSGTTRTQPVVPCMPVHYLTRSEVNPCFRAALWELKRPRALVHERFHQGVTHESLPHDLAHFNTLTEGAHDSNLHNKKRTALEQARTHLPMTRKSNIWYCATSVSTGWCVIRGST